MHPSPSRQLEEHNKKTDSLPCQWWAYYHRIYASVRPKPPRRRIFNVVEQIDTNWRSLRTGGVWRSLALLALTGRRRSCMSRCHSVSVALLFSCDGLMETTLTLTNTPLDLQITICTLLHPSDILALRKVCRQWTLWLNLLVVYKTYYKTCKALELATRQRIV
jgi:hypothetical protein